MLLHLGVRDQHDLHHMGVDRSLYLARLTDPTVTRAEVAKVVRSCERCQSINPAPVKHSPGNLSVDKTWSRIAVDVTHYQNVPFLSIIDCGPGRLAVWRRIPNETAENICDILEEIFLERGPVEEVLMDNGSAFRSRVMRDFLKKWKVSPFYRAAYRAAGNGIVERHHKTIKSLAEKGRLKPEEAVFWYNVAPKSGVDANTVPQRSIFTYDWRLPVMDPETSQAENPRISIGDEVWVKPPGVRCTTQWGRGRVTEINSDNNVSVDGMPRHILDVRRVVIEEESDEEGSSDCPESGGVEQQPGGPEVNETVDPPNERRYPARIRQPPAWLTDYDH